jgi:Tol biopolymer transport system component
VSAEVALRSAIEKETVEGDLKSAAEEYKKVVSTHRENRGIAARALLQLGRLQHKLGQSADARSSYERLIAEFGEQKEAADARKHLAALKEPSAAAAQNKSVVLKKLHESADVVSAQSWSADGRYLIYSSRLPGPRGLVMHDYETGETRLIKVAGNNETIFTATLSPDGRTLAYRIQYGGANVRQELRAISVDGTGDRLLVSNPELDATWPGPWSPDGKQILTVFERRDNTRQLALVAASTGAVAVLKSFDWRLARPFAQNWSPDGRTILYATNPEIGRKDADVYWLSADGKAGGVLIEGPANDEPAGWSPDGRLLIVSDRSGGKDLWAVAVSGGKATGEPVLIQRQLPDMFSRRITEDGTFHYSKLHKLTGAYVAGVDVEGGRLTSPPAHVTATTRDQNLLPAFSPDGKRVAVFSLGPPQWKPTIIVRDTASGQETTFHSEQLGNIYALRWHPDGRSLVMRGYDSQRRWGIHRVDLGTGSVQPLFQALMADFDLPSMSRDGHMLYYVYRNRDAKTEVLRERDLRTGAERDIVSRAQGSNFSYALSPDGLRAAVFTGEWNGSGTYELVDVRSGEVVFRASLARTVYAPAWSTDGKYLVYHDNSRSDPTKAALYRLTVATGEVAAMGNLNIAAVRGETQLAPDGKQVAIFSLREVMEFWAMHNLFTKQRTSR